MNYEEILKSADALFSVQPNNLALLSNASAFIFETFDLLNWSGFYLFDGEKLTVGPFQGKVACSTIELGKGVCGESAILRKTLVIDDVLNHSNHIACDANSRSEVVIPIIVSNTLYGVLDVDSPILNRFDLRFVHFFERFVEILINYIDNSHPIG